MNTRSKIIATVAVLWIAVLGVISFQMLSTDETNPDITPEIRARCLAVHPDVDNPTRQGRRSFEQSLAMGERRNCAERLAEQVPDYDAAGAAVKAAGASLIALVIGGATIIWTRPKANEQVVASTPNSSPPAPKPKVAPTPAPTAETVASSAADPASALRQLKALHDEGILTDDEYETKRKALTDQL